MIGDKDLLFNDGKLMRSNLDTFKIEDLPPLSSNFNGQIIINDENNGGSLTFDIRNGKLVSINYGEIPQ